MDQVWTDTDGTAGLEPIAVVGLACRVPGAGDAATFWRNLVRGVESRTELTRQQMAAAGMTPEELDDPQLVPAAFLLDDVEFFDAGLFGCTAREAALLDPQHRLFLELCHTALEDAGYDPARYSGDVGVYGGRGMETYRWQHIYRNRAVAAVSDHMTVGIGNHADSITTLVSHRLNLRGPSVGIYTACSSSLVAVHVAAEALRSGECDMALAGGACIELPTGRGYVHHEGGVASADGHCRPFDASATGTVWGSGGGAVLLKRLDDAIADGDTIRAVVRGNAINNDGSAKVGFTAPSVEGQAAVITAALSTAGVDPQTVTYVEAHGTGTPIGDPIEVAALTAALTRTAPPGAVQWCALGSAKSNIGHLSQAAGVVGMIKTVLALQHGLIPPTLGFTLPNPAIDFPTSPFYVNATPATWDTGAGPRRAGVSSFGIGGTNAHVVLEQAPPPATASQERRPRLVQVSARSAAALDTAVRRLADHLDADSALDLADVAHTLRTGRAAYPHRAAVVATTTADAVAALRQTKRRITGVAGRAPRVVLLLSGQGSQYAGMGAELYAAEPVFAAAVDQCADLLAAILDRDLRQLMFATGDAEADALLGRTELTQPALFTIEYALARLWQSWGLHPTTMIGHSVGQYVAATLAGVFELPDALRLVALRGRLMGAMPPGAMLTVALGEADLAARLPDGVDLAVVNGPRACVVAGPVDRIDEFAAALAADGVGTKRLRTSHAFHSAMMAPVLEEFAAAVAAVPRQAPATPYLSDHTGEPVTAEQAVDPLYWAAHLRRPVRFGVCVARALADGPTLFLECGPGKQLAGLARMQVPRAAPLPLTSLPARPGDGVDLAAISTAAGALWAAGVPLDVGGSGTRVPLPTYPYERSRHWIEPDPAAPVPPPTSTTADARLPLDEWFTVPTWRRAPHTTPAPPACGRHVVLADGAFGDALVARLRADGADVVEVRPGERFESAGDRVTVRPAEPADFTALLAHIGNQPPQRYVHAWTVTDDSADADRGLFSLLHLVQSTAAQGLVAPLDVITAGTQRVVGDDLTRPLDAMVAGVIRSAPYDLPDVRFRHVDLPDGAGPGVVPAALAALAAADGSDPVAVRGGLRWLCGYEPVRLPQAPPTAGLRERGVYLITGGAGGLGLAVAEDLARRVGARVVLLGRKAPVEAAIRRVEAAGGAVLPVIADVTDAAALRDVRRRILERFGRLDGIVHAAGVAGGGLTETRSRSEAMPVLAPKVAGTLALAEVFQDLPLDVVLLFSSVVGTVGGLGEVDYCAANAFLDAYAQSRHGWRASVRSVAWTGWRGAGMLARAGLVTPVDHPLLDPAGSTVDGVTTFHGSLRSDEHWVLDGHRVSGVPLLPGTAQLDLARAAFAAAVPAPPAAVVELSDALFSAPLFVPDGDTVEITVTVRPGVEGHDVTIGAPAPGTLFTRATVRWVAAPAPARLDLDAIRGRTSTGADLAPQLPGEGGAVRFGPHWNTVREIRASGPGEEGEQLTLLELAEALRADLPRWEVHPALLDQGASRYGRYRPGDSYLPMAYGQLRLYAPLPGRIWVYSPGHPGASDPMDGGSEVYGDDFVIADDAGRVLATIGELTMRRVDHDSVAAGGTTRPRVEHSPNAPDPRAWITPAEGVAALHRVLANDPGPHVIVSPQPLDRIRERATADANQPVARPGRAAGEPVAVRSVGARRTPPRTQRERQLLDVWAAVLGTEDIGTDDDFFDLGGNSLIAVQLIAQVRRTLGMKFPMRRLFDAPTVAGMAAHVADLETAAPAQGGQQQTAIPRLARPRRVEDSGSGTSGGPVV